MCPLAAGRAREQAEASLDALVADWDQESDAIKALREKKVRTLLCLTTLHSALRLRL